MARPAWPAAVRAGASRACRAWPPLSAAQFFSFGQNKIQYRRLDWRILRGAHVDLYYYPGRSRARARRAGLRGGELRHPRGPVRPRGRRPAFPLIVYASHTDFEQTNILPFTPPEGLLGATDFLKRRVSLPFRGNFAEFRHTMRHEMVHVFQLDLLIETYYQRPARSRFNFPLWWTEGLAELWSGGQDARDEMVMRDLTLSGRLPAAQGSSPTSPAASCIRSADRSTAGSPTPTATGGSPLCTRSSTGTTASRRRIHGVYGRTLDQLSDEFQLAMRRQLLPVGGQPRPALASWAREVAKLAVKPAFCRTRNGGSGRCCTSRPPAGYVSIYQRSARRRPARTRS